MGIPEVQLGDETPRAGAPDGRDTSLTAARQQPTVGTERDLLGHRRVRESCTFLPQNVQTLSGPGVPQHHGRPGTRTRRGGDHRPHSVDHDVAQRRIKRRIRKRQD